MNISISKEEDSPTKQEAENTLDGNVNKASPWLRQKDPRIVRVSRAFGGKDRHSKVCTVRGLRDRRVRLSVPTAIQLYDLQDRLGLNQPSKVIDWLLNAAKQEIDELPPLPIAPMNFALNHHEIFPNKEGCKISNWGDQDLWNNRAKSKQLERDTSKKTESNVGQLAQYEKNHCSSSYGSYYQLDNSNFASSNFPGIASQSSDLNALSLSSSSQVFVPQPYFPAHNLTSSANRQINQFQMFSSSTQNLLPSSINTSDPYSMNDQSSGSSRGLNFNIAPRFFNSSIGGSQADDRDHQDFPCR